MVSRWNDPRRLAAHLGYPVHEFHLTKRRLDSFEGDPRTVGIGVSLIEILGQVMLHFRSFGHIMLQESSQCLHTQTESKAVTVAILCLIRPDYAGKSGLR
jgi:hypothetical protein